MDVFVYGTLTEPERVTSVVDSYAFVGGAVVDGLHPVEGRYPTLAPGGEVAGRILRTDDVDALDRYEGVDSGLYVRVDLPWDESARAGSESDESGGTGAGANGSTANGSAGTRSAETGSAESGPTGAGPSGIESPGAAESNGERSSGGRDSVAVYVGDPDRLAVREPVTWPGDGPLDVRVRRYVADEGVRVRPVD